MLDTDRTDAEDGKRVIDGDGRLVGQDDDDECSEDNPTNHNEDRPCIKPESACASHWKGCHVLWAEARFEQRRPVGTSHIVPIGNTFVALASLDCFWLTWNGM
jgi:hypothetical protein